MGCNKVGYESKAVAKKDIQAIKVQHKKQSKRLKHSEGVKLSPYKCTDCPLWHITSQRPFKKSKATYAKRLKKRRAIR